MSTEQKILEQILKEGGNAPVHLIAKKLKMNNGYVDYLCKGLLKKGLIKKWTKNDWYQVTHEEKKIEETEGPKATEAKKPSKSKTTKDRKKAARWFHKERLEVPPLENKIKPENKTIRIQKIVMLLKKKSKKLTEFLKNFIQHLSNTLRKGARLINRRRTPKVL